MDCNGGHRERKTNLYRPFLLYVRPDLRLGLRVDGLVRTSFSVCGGMSGCGMRLKMLMWRGVDGGRNGKERYNRGKARWKWKWKWSRKERVRQPPLSSFTSRRNECQEAGAIIEERAGFVFRRR
jgi:hypothetical protein